MSDKTKIMQRIKKLFALAGANPSEAEAMASMFAMLSGGEFIGSEAEVTTCLP